MKKVPQRTCVICRTQKNKEQLLRIVKNKDNELDDNTKQKNTFFDTLDIEIEKSGYEVGEWEKEVRKDLIPIIKVKTKYKPNKEINVLVGGIKHETGICEG